MNKLFLTTAIILAAASTAQAVNAPSLGERMKMNWDKRADRNAWGDTYQAPSDTMPADAGDRARMRDEAGVDTKGMPGDMHHGKRNMTPEQRAAKKAKWDNMTPEQRAARKADHKAKMMDMTPEQRAKMKADRKAKWDMMTPEQKAAWKAKRMGKKDMMMKKDHM